MGVAPMVAVPMVVGRLTLAMVVGHRTARAAAMAVASRVAIPSVVAAGDRSRPSSAFI